MASFSFSFGGDDIEEENPENSIPAQISTNNSTQPEAARPTAGAFPVLGKPQLPPVSHGLQDMLRQMPSKIAYGTLDVTLDDGNHVRLPRRELWDVRVQLMAEAETEADGGLQGGDVNEGPEGLGGHDVKTGVYEGGFKSWESSVDLVKVLGAEGHLNAERQRPLRVVELGCGTALPTLAIFLCAAKNPGANPPLSLVLADYNPTVLQLVTLPNFLLAWALSQKDSDSCPALQGAFDPEEEELELTPEVIAAFQEFLASTSTSLSFLSGGWSPELVHILYQGDNAPNKSREGSDTLILGAETIYSPFALDAFNETVFRILTQEKSERDKPGCQALVAAKRHYFGVGGSLDDFVDKARGRGATVTQLREEVEGVRRGVVRCVL